MNFFLFRPQRLGRPGEGQIAINFIGAKGQVFGSQMKLAKDGKVFNLEKIGDSETDLLSSCKQELHQSKFENDI